METLNNLLTNWRNSKNIEDVIAKYVTLAPDKMEGFLSSLSDAERASAMADLGEMAEALEKHIASLEILRDDVKGQLDKNIENTKAHLSYVTANSYGKKRRRDE